MTYRIEVAQALGDNVNRLAQLILRDDQRRSEADAGGRLSTRPQQII